MGGDTNPRFDVGGMRDEGARQGGAVDWYLDECTGSDC